MMQGAALQLAIWTDWVPGWFSTLISERTRPTIRDTGLLGGTHSLMLSPTPIKR